MLTAVEIRRRWRRVVVLTVFVGIVGALVLSAMAGARRSESALARFNASSRTANLELTVGDPTPLQLREFGGVAGVESFAPLRGIALEVPSVPELSAVADALDTRFGTVVDRPRVVAGRAADFTAADEVTIGEGLAAPLHLRVGDDLATRSFTPKQIEICFKVGCAQNAAPVGPRIPLRIVGIVRRPLDLGDRGASGGVLVMTPAFTDKYGKRIGSWSGDVLRVRTRDGAADVPQVVEAARRIFGRTSAFASQDLSIESQGAQNAIDVLAKALWVLAGVAALAGLVAFTIVLSREISLVGIDQATQTALGLTRPQRVAVAAFSVLPVVLGGAVLAAAGAAAASSRFPVGVAWRAEPDPGLRIDGTVLALGTLAVAGVIALIAVLAALRTTRRTRSAPSAPGTTTRLIGAANRAGVTPIATTGVRMALEPGRGPTTVPVRSGMLGAVFGVLGVVAVLMFASSVHSLSATPAHYGWTWDFAAVPDAPSVFAAGSPLLHERGLAAAAEVDTFNMQLDEHPVTGWGFTPVRGTINPEIIRGRTPQGPNEIALGDATLGALGKQIGDTVRGDGPDGSHTYRIVGDAVFPKFDQPQPLANGAAMTGAGLEQLLSETDNHNGSAYLIARVTPGAELTTVEHEVATIPNIERPFGPTVPVEVDRLRQINWLSVTLAALLAILALLAVGHALVTSVRRRRHEFAILKTLGFNRSQIRGAVAWQATTIATIGLVAGIPAGVLVGGLVWRQVANGLGVATAPVHPASAVLITIPCALAAANLIAFFPARSAAHTRAAVALRSE